ncbi:MAG: hypothetical protein ACPGTU_03945 [Myxococcota bacterium]
MTTLIEMSDYSRRNNNGSTSSSGESSTSSAEAAQVDQPIGNAATLDEMKIEGAFGRVFNRIAGESESNSEAQNTSFNVEDVKRYLDVQLKLADGEMFRGTKVKGAAEAIVEELDANKDGEVTWAEFQAMRETMRANLVGELGANAGSTEIEAMANDLFHEMNNGEEVDYDTMNEAAREKLPDGTKHAKLVAQLSALLVLDLVDLDEGHKPVRERSISEAEWMSSVQEFSDG